MTLLVAKASFHRNRKRKFIELSFFEAACCVCWTIYLKTPHCAKFIVYMVYNINSILLNHDIISFNISGFRLNTTVYAKKTTGHWVDCAIECVKDSCCRSVNYKTIITAGNEENCEMLHNLVYNTSDDQLKENGTYNYIFFNSPMKVKTLSFNIN